jgi:nicotinamidase-related amidase
MTIIAAMTGRKNRDLHGAAPDHANDALLILDMISDFRFPSGARLLRRALPVAERIASLRDRATAAGVPVVYVNDNADRWRSDFSGLLQASLAQGSRGAPIATRLRPRAIDYAVLKPKHSGFFATPLATLLEYLGARRLVLTGVSTDQCVLFTATDAYVRDFELVIPRDAVASETESLHRLSLQYCRQVLGAKLPSASRVRFMRRSSRA